MEGIRPRQKSYTAGRNVPSCIYSTRDLDLRVSTVSIQSN